MHEQQKNGFLKGAAILAATGIIVKIIGAIYKIPLFNVLDDEGVGYFQVTYNVYAMILAMSTAGVPVALSRIVSSAATSGNTALVRRYFSVVMPAFIIIGVVVMSVMFFFANEIATMIGSSHAATGLQVLAPAVFFVCMIAVFRGYAQGFENMIPTAASQMVEVISKAVFGIGVAFFLARLGYESQYVAAGSITGVTIGLGLCIPLMIWYKRKIDRTSKLEAGTQGDNSRMLDTANTKEPSQCLPVTGADEELPSRMRVFLRFMKVSIPITLSASLMSIMVLIDTRVVLGRLQSALLLTEPEAAEQFGIFTKGLTIYNLPPSLIVPVAISIIPAIAAAIARGNKNEASSIMQSSAKLTNLFAMPACAGIMVLAGPILKALYYDPRQSPETVTTMTIILVILGAASYFVCFQHLTIAVLQANGYERVALITFPIGAIVKITLSYILVANPDIGIIGSPIGTLACFATITALNLLFIAGRVKERFRLVSCIIKPLVCALLMALIAFLTYEGISRLGSGFLGTGRSAVIIYLGIAIIVGVIAYAALVISVRVINKEDLAHFPKGEKMAKYLGIR